MTEHKLFYYPCASFTSSQPALLKVGALYVDKLIILDPVGARWATIGADEVARGAIKQLHDQVEAEPAKGPSQHGTSCEVCLCSSRALYASRRVRSRGPLQ